MLTLTLAIEITVSLLLAQVTGLSAGGIIAPGYVALMLGQPNVLVALALVTGGTWLIVVVLSRVLFLWGTRRFGMMVLVALVLGLGLESLRLPIGLAGIALDWGGLGYIVPGLIANQIDRQGWIRTADMGALDAKRTAAEGPIADCFDCRIDRCRAPGGLRVAAKAFRRRGFRLHKPDLGALRGRVLRPDDAAGRGSRRDGRSSQ